MKALTQKILEAGLVDKHTALLMEKWGHLEPGEADLVGRRVVSRGSLQALVDEIEALLEKEPIFKETRLDLPVAVKKGYLNAEGEMFQGLSEEMGRVVFGPKALFKAGETLYDMEKNDWYVIRQVDEFYDEDRLTALLVTME